MAINDHHLDLTTAETTTMSDQTLHPTTAAAAAPTTHSGRRRLGFAAVATVALGAGLVPVALGNSGAGAIDNCPVPAAVGCPTEPIPTIPPPPPPPASWQVNVRSLMQDTGFTGSVQATRYWLQSPVIIADPPIANAPARLTIPTRPLTVTPAGTATLDAANRLKFPVIPMPSGATMVLRMTEAGSPGSLCRTKPVSPLPPSGHGLHLLVPKPVAKSATDLRAMVQGFKGVQTGTPAGTKVNVTATNLVPKSTGVELRLRGRIDVGTTLHFSFYYRILLDLNPYNGTLTGQSISVAAPNRVGSLELSFVGTPPPNGSAILTQARPQIRDQLRAAVMSKATPSVNASISGISDVKWWTDQGFTLSIRRVAYSTTGINVYPSFCMLG